MSEQSQAALKRLTLSNPIHFLALGFGSGLSPLMPGTVGTLAALPIVWLMVSYLTPLLYLLMTILVCLVGVWLCQRTADDMQVHDHGAIVWDEIAGYMIAMLAVPLSWQNMFVAFVLFRFFDIVKPWPISWLDKQVHGGLGIMLDDILAGVFSLLIMHALLTSGWLV